MIRDETLEECIPEFLAEVTLALAALNADLIRLAETPDDLKPLGCIFRAFHNIKGTSGFLGLPRVGRLCHAAESVLAQLRDHALPPTPCIIDALMRCVDAIGAIVDTIRPSGSEGSGSDDGLIAELNLLSDTALSPARQHQSDAMHGAPLRWTAAAVAGTGIQPIAAAWAILPRIADAIATRQGKKIELVMEGADTALESRVLERLRAPLIHMIRNAADHGIETPDVRAASGKPETGRIWLRAFRDRGFAVIEMTDDGRGLDHRKIRRGILETGLADEIQLAAMTDATIARFILQPGISTAAEITEISGRGVGLDVVRANIESMNGTIDIASSPRRGVSFVIKIPVAETP
jgi:chemotaxis protein histidine kinase CheA